MRSTVGHLVHMYRRGGAIVGTTGAQLIVSRATHVHDLRQDAFGCNEARQRQHDRTEPTNPMLRRYIASVPRPRVGSGAPIVDERQTLSLGIFEVDRRATIAFR